MAEPYVPIAQLAPYTTLMTNLENAINTIDDDTTLIIADKNSAQTNAATIAQYLGENKISLMLGGS